MPIDFTFQNHLMTLLKKFLVMLLRLIDIKKTMTSLFVFIFI